MRKLFFRNTFNRPRALFVVIGAIPGALLRWQLGNDFLSNVIGCALLGIITGLEVNSRIQFLLVIGFCGSLTTFSGWIINLGSLLQKGFFVQLASSFFLILITAFLSLLVGFFIGKKFLKTFFP